ncbi:glycoside hydrolase family 35 protein [Longispora albida]|uniref:glycoside hydrolase family 35 protein n=1 Tax=Longispora albida TaxID=203523 RepID=UPI000365952F|nr:glycoside hydrolase family 35 protein [Longispora albida]
MSFVVTPAGFELHGKPFRVLSGAMHYFRSLPAQWPQRLRMLRAMGLNTVETYVAWNHHEPVEGRIERLDEVARFLDDAAGAGLHAIVRPGPYICAEWDNGGFPAWLTGSGVPLRCHDQRYLAPVERFFAALMPIVAERQVTRGGNVLMVQVENEYGSYGSDQRYLRHLADVLREYVDVPLFTSDGPEDHMLTGGSVPGILATVNFGSDAKAAFAKLRQHRPDDPPMCMEFWNGWFDHWGDEHITRPADDAAASLAEILELGGSVNLYMAHGGTNFGTYAGANRGGRFHDGEFQPTVTSYDYDAPIDERGGPTAKFWAFREVLERYNIGTSGLPEALPDVEPLPPVLEPRAVTLGEAVSWRAALGPAVSSPVPLSFEDLGVVHGLVCYRAELPGPRQGYPLTVDGLADRAHVFVNEKYEVTFERDGLNSIDDVPGPAVVELLVESLGRVNYGPRTGETKGFRGLLHERQYVHGWSASLLTWDDVPWGAGVTCDGPVFTRGSLDVNEPRDGYLSVRSGQRGYVWVNGFLLGRYNASGPQHTLYLPAPILRTGANEVVVLELDGVAQSAVNIEGEAG